jgi:PadR family transcriptional regulator, regulatory protein PadR
LRPSCRIGAVYATLARLDEKGYVKFRISDPLPIQGGRSRKQVLLTAAGRRALAHSVEMFKRILPDLSPAEEQR